MPLQLLTLLLQLLNVFIFLAESEALEDTSESALLKLYRNRVILAIPPYLLLPSLHDLLQSSPAIGQFELDSLLPFKFHVLLQKLDDSEFHCPVVGLLLPKGLSPPGQEIACAHEVADLARLIRFFEQSRLLDQCVLDATESLPNNSLLLLALELLNFLVCLSAPLQLVLPARQESLLEEGCSDFILLLNQLLVLSIEEERTERLDD